MQAIIRETAFGQIVRLITRNRLFQYPEERSNFELPPQYSGEKDAGSEIMQRIATQESSIGPIPTRDSVRSSRLDPLEIARTPSKIYTHPYTEERFAAEQRLELANTRSILIIPQKTADGIVLVDWYTTDDPENPQNWPTLAKHLVVCLTCTYTWVIYTASTIIAPSEGRIIEQFGVSETEAILPLALFVLAYGVGPLIFGPLSEIPAFGRNWIYIVTFLLFFALSFPTAVTDSFAGLLILRFLTGFFASPALANAGATFSDIFSLIYLPYYLSWWTWAAWAGPALGFTLSGFAVTAKNWHWALWEVVWINFKCKYSPSTGKAASQAYEQSTIEVSERNRSSKIKDPSILFIHVYTGLFYGIYYSFFECLPLIFPPDYHFNLVETGLAFLACGVGATLGQMIYFCYLKWYMIPDNLKNGLREQEHRLVPGAIAAWLLPVGLMVFAWTARPDIHWIVCLIGVVLFVIGFFIVMQALFVYLPLSYPKYAASLFTANDLLRSLNAFASVLYARPLFINLGVDKGVTLLGGLTCAGALGMIWLYFFGKKLRAMSSFAEG